MRILVATDGSESALEAASVGLALFPHGAEITLLTVVAPERIPLAVSGDFEVPTMTPLNAQRLHDLDLARGRQALDQTRRVVDSRVTPELIAGTDIADAICGYASECGAHVVVLGESGHGWLHHVLHGSVVQHVVQRAPCAVLMVPHHSLSRRE